MITYELAKNLKEAGYPQGYNPKYDTGSGGAPGSDIRTPTLSELIEACVQDDFRLIGCSILKRPFWIATSISSIEQGDKLYQGTASTPEEAVARLWLALNPKVQSESSK